jgi:hypothetical protein
MFEKADIVDGGDHRHGATDGRGILHVQEIGTVLPDLGGQVETQPEKRVGGNAPDPDLIRNERARLHAGNICQNLTILVRRGKRVQKASNVYLISCEVSADGVGINGEEH